MVTLSAKSLKTFLVCFTAALACALCAVLVFASPAQAANQVPASTKAGWVRSSNGDWYHFKSAGAAPTTGWLKDGGSWYYLDPADNGAMAAGKWVKDGSSEYYVTGSGAMKTGWVKVSSKWYYLGKNGAKQTGWIKDGSWYFLDKADNGAMAAGKWVKDGSSEYYLATSGAMRTGWTKVGTKWYYLNGNGTKRTGWLKDGSWYYLDKADNGAMAAGKWVKDGSSEYYLASSGAMRTGWTKVGTKWYYLNGNGTKKTGWLKSGGKWYYLDKNNGGAMAANTKIYIGNEGFFAFDSNGVNRELYQVKAMLSEREWVKNAREGLGVPNTSNITYSVDLSGSGYFWEAGSMYTRYIVFYEDGERCAFATCEADTGFPQRTMYGYFPPSER